MSSGREQLSRIKIPLSPEDALRGAMEVEPPAEKPKRKAKRQEKARSRKK